MLLISSSKKYCRIVMSEGKVIEHQYLFSCVNMIALFLIVKLIACYISGITYAADWISYVVLIHLFWPSRSVLYLIKGEQPLPQYDLEAAGRV